MKEVMQRFWNSSQCFITTFIFYWNKLQPENKGDWILITGRSGGGQQQQQPRHYGINTFPNFTFSPFGRLFPASNLSIKGGAVFLNFTRVEGVASESIFPQTSAPDDSNPEGEKTLQGYDGSHKDTRRKKGNLRCIQRAASKGCTTSLSFYLCRRILAEGGEETQDSKSPLLEEKIETLQK